MDDTMTEEEINIIAFRLFTNMPGINVIFNRCFGKNRVNFHVENLTGRPTTDIITEIESKDHPRVCATKTGPRSIDVMYTRDDFKQEIERMWSYHENA